MHLLPNCWWGPARKHTQPHKHTHTHTQTHTHTHTHAHTDAAAAALPNCQPSKTNRYKWHACPGSDKSNRGDGGGGKRREEEGGEGRRRKEEGPNDFKDPYY